MQDEPTLRGSDSAEMAFVGLVSNLKAFFSFKTFSGNPDVLMSWKPLDLNAVGVFIQVCPQGGLLFFSVVF